MPNPQSSLREQVHEVMRFLRYSARTEETYWYWVLRYLRLHRRPGLSGRAAWRHPREMGTVEVREFLTHLAVELKVSGSTQIYTHVLARPGIGVRSPLDG